MKKAISERRRVRLMLSVRAFHSIEHSLCVGAAQTGNAFTVPICTVSATFATMSPTNLLP